MTDFTFKPHDIVPFKDRDVLERIRNIRRADITKHSNPDFRIRVIRDSEIGWIPMIERSYRLHKAIEEELRPPISQVLTPNNRNIDDYSKMLADRGGADACFSGSGWAGHIAFIGHMSNDRKGRIDVGNRMRFLHGRNGHLMRRLVREIMP